MTRLTDWNLTSNQGTAMPKNCVSESPDLDAEDRWRSKLAMLRTITPTAGIVTTISNMATPEQRAAKLDIADFLLDAASRNNPIV